MQSSGRHTEPSHHAEPAHVDASAVDPVLAPVPTIDTAALVEQIRHTTGHQLELLGPAPGGQVGAGFVRWPDGRQGVLTWWGRHDADAIAQLQRTAGLLDLARSRGLPVPGYDLIAEVPAGVAIVQERLPGQPPERVDLPLVQAMVEVNERCADLLATRPDVAVADLYLDRSAHGFCIHESLERYDDRTRRLLDWVRDVGRSTPRGMTGDDLVHLDFHAGNVLVGDRRRITGIVDWDGVGRGDRRFALVTLRFDMAGPERAAGPAVAAWLDDLLDDLLDPATLRLYWAHMSLRMVDWAIRHFGPDDVTFWLGVAARRSG